MEILTKREPSPNDRIHIYFVRRMKVGDKWTSKLILKGMTVKLGKLLPEQFRERLVEAIRNIAGE